MKKYNLIAVIVMVISAANTSSFARIGESKLEIEKRFGVGVAIPKEREVNQACETLVYTYNAWNIVVKFINNTSQYEKYNKSGVTVTDSQVIMKSIFPDSVVVDKLGIQNLSPLNNNGRGNISNMEVRGGYEWNLISKSSSSRSYLLAWGNESPILSCQCEATSVLICSPEYFKRTNTGAVGF